MNWISVKERMPKDEEKVLIFADGEIHLMTYNANWQDFTGIEDCFEESKIKHWMPLPEPPKEEA